MKFLFIWYLWENLLMSSCFVIHLQCWRVVNKWVCVHTFYPVHDSSLKPLNSPYASRVLHVHLVSRLFESRWSSLKCPDRGHVSLQPLLSSHWETQSDKSSYKDIILLPSHPSPCSHQTSMPDSPLFAHCIDQVKTAVKLGQAAWMSCNKWWISFAVHFFAGTWHMRYGNHS